MTAETVEADCRNGHVHTYPGPAGRAVKCRTSRCRVSLWLKVGNARTVGAASDIAALWARESPPGDLLEDAEPADEKCPQCGGECVWEGRRTMLYCLECEELSTPEFVAERYERRRAAEAGGRQGERGEELAVREPSPAERRQAEAVLAAHREELADALRKAIDALDVAGLPDSTARVEAVRWRGSLGSYVPHIRGARTAEELAEIREEILSLAPQYQQVAENVRQERRRLEHLERARQYEAAQYEAAQRAALEAQYEAKDEYDDVPPGTMVPVNPPYSGTAVMLGQALLARQQRAEQRGYCQFPHSWKRRLADYDVYGTQYQYGGPDGYGPLKACRDHHDAAVEYVTGLGWPYYRAESTSGVSYGM